MIETPPGFIWAAPDAGKIQCIECGEKIDAVTADLHTCGGSDE
jgi:hypothetical protein